MNDPLALVTCGSVDDGKSTLLGRLLYDSEELLEDQLKEIQSSSTVLPDFSLAFDGLAAEREQGITIDVAYRSFSSHQRRFLIADVPGHEQYTRNMITGASTADVALLVVDVSKGFLNQSRRHAYIAWLLGIRCFILAVNKMDLVNFRREAFERTEAEYNAFLSQLGSLDYYAIPVSARFGDNVMEHSVNLSWFAGPSLSEVLHEIEVARPQTAPFRFPVQWINRACEGLRGYSGLVAGGSIKVGEKVKVQPSGQEANVSRIITYDGPLENAGAGELITLTLDNELDIGRGHVICGTEGGAECADTLEATVIWMGESPLMRGRSYRLKLGSKTVTSQITRIRHKVDVDTLAELAADTLKTNEIGACTLALDEPVAFDAYNHNRHTGGFILIDRISNDTIAAGLIRSGELKHRDVPWQRIDVSKISRSTLKNQRPAVLWFTGISGAGKSTIANLVEKMLHAQGRHTYLLDGDNIRHGLNRDLGFSDSDRIENVRRVAEVAKLMADAGLIVLVALISPFQAERRSARKTIGDDEFIEIYVDTPLKIAEARDPKGLYVKARQGQLAAFTGINSTYETPEKPELRIDTTSTLPGTAAERIVTFLERHFLAREHGLP